MALTYSPSYPIADEIVSLSITGATGSTDATRFEIASVPENSGLETGMLTDEAGDPAQSFTPDVAGAYEVTAYDYRRYIGIPAYAGDPVGEARDLLVATQSGTVYVADVLDLPIRGAEHQITLRVKVVNATVVEASLEGPTTERARMAALDSGILVAVGALEGEAAASIGDSLVTMAATFTDKFNGHLANTSAHTLADTSHSLDDAAFGDEQAGAVAWWQLATDAFRGHLTVDGGWHGDLDYAHIPIAPKATSIAGAYIQMCDLLRCYATHIIFESGVHTNDDATNTLPALAPLTEAVIAVLDFFAEEAPDPPAKENPGALTLAAKYGFAAAAA